ncbi:MAG: LysR family transcriptional regulator [Betaproteobacteria bacterium]|nr:MAG: LysR family transcriptional regulator [Betaproteobacteria bacterium]
MPGRRIRRYLRHGLLPQLAVFEAVARLGSYTRAAEELFVAQPTVSIQMKKLSETLGVPLFEQSGKRPILTDAGRELAAACNDIFGRLEQVEERLIGLRDLDHGRLRIAASSFGKYFIPRLLGEFCNRHPKIEVSMHIDNWRGIRQRIQENADDLYVLSNLPQELELTAYPLLVDPIEVFAPAGHPLVGEHRIAFSRLAEEPFLLREPGSATRRIAQEACSKNGITPRVRMELASDEAVKQSVIAGLGIALLPRRIVDSRSDEAQVCVLDVQGFPVVRQWYIVHQRGKQLPRVASAFLDFARANADPELFISSAAVARSQALAGKPAR